MKIIIAEKPKVAKAIAAAISNYPVNKQGYIEAGSFMVTWQFGHLLENSDPESYDPSWKKWKFDTIPFQIGYAQWSLKEKSGSKNQLDVIRGLLKQATLVINAGDPDREGLMLVNETIDYCGYKGRVQRIILNSNDTLSIKKALAEAEPNENYRNLYEAARCRSRSDWLYGLSVTRAATLAYAKYGDGPVSLGRVQTPTLWMVVKRDLEIENFVAKEFFTLTASVKVSSGTVVELVHEPLEQNRLWLKPEADAIRASLINRTVSLKVTAARKKTSPPLPYTLLTFSKDAITAFGWTAQDCLNTLQSLYDDGFTTYPRTDCPYLKREQMPDAIRIGNVSAKILNVPQGLARLFKARDSVYDSSKVEEHHGIILTGKEPYNPSNDQALALSLVARRFVASLLPDYEYTETVAQFLHAKRIFKTRGESPCNPDACWKVVMPPTKNQPKLLPSLTDGENGVVCKLVIKKGETTPPKRYTEADLMEDMSSVAKYVADPAIKAKLKETAGIGTSATWANIIEGLKQRNYVYTDKKNLISTQFGRKLIEICSPRIKDPGLTALWETALEKVAKGEDSAESFMNRVNVFVKQCVAGIKAQKGTVVMPPRSATDQKKKALTAHRVHKAGTTAPKPLATKDSTRSTKGRTQPTKGLNSFDGKPSKPFL